MLLPLSFKHCQSLSHCNEPLLDPTSPASLTTLLLPLKLSKSSLYSASPPTNLPPASSPASSLSAGILKIRSSVMSNCQIYRMLFHFLSHRSSVLCLILLIAPQFLQLFSLLPAFLAAFSLYLRLLLLSHFPLLSLKCWCSPGFRTWPMFLAHFPWVMSPILSVLLKLCFQPRTRLNIQHLARHLCLDFLQVTQCVQN